jgi:hypothetical protein
MKEDVNKLIKDWFYSKSGITLIHDSWLVSLVSDIEALYATKTTISYPSSTEIFDGMGKVARGYKSQGVKLDENSFLSGIDFIKTYIDLNNGC